MLVHSLIRPQPDLTVDWRSSETRMSDNMMQHAATEGKAHHGWLSAREELFRYIDNKTIIMGHGLQTALESLRVLHTRVIDTAQMASRALLRRNDLPHLEDLCQDVISNDINWDRTLLHGCTFQALAAREFVMRNMENADELALWGQIRREE